MTVENLFSRIPGHLPEELESQLASGGQFRLKRIVSRGHVSPQGEWYDQDEAEWVILLSGGAKLEFAGNPELLTLAPGDHITIPPHSQHRVAWTDPLQDTVWLAIYFK